jgi:ribose transport system substrate-binding protein
MEPAFARAAAADIPVVGFNSEAPSVNTVIKQDLFWTCTATEDAAAFIAGIKPNANVLVMGGAQVPVLNFVVECFEKAAEAAGLTVLDRQDNVDDAPGPAQPIAADLLTRHPDVEAFWALNDTTAQGIYAAMQAAGLQVMTQDQDGILLVANCCGGQPSADAVAAGRLSAMYDTQSIEAGAAAIGALKTVIVDGQTPAEMPELIDIPTVRYDFDNIDTYVPYEDRDLTSYAEGDF